MKKILCLAVISFCANAWSQLISADAKTCKVFYVKNGKITKQSVKCFSASGSGKIELSWDFANGKSLRNVAGVEFNPATEATTEFERWFVNNEEAIRVKKPKGIKQKAECFSPKSNKNETYCIASH